MKSVKTIVLGILILLVTHFAWGQSHDAFSQNHTEPIKLVKFFPNPATDFLIIKFETPLARTVKLTLHTIIGNSLEVESEIVDDFEIGLHSAVRNNNGQDYFTFRKRVQSSGIANIDLLIMNSDMDYYKKKKDWSNYATSAVAYMDKYGGNEAQKLNGVAWIFYENITERKMLEHAEAWALKAVTIEDNYAFNDTYAAVLFKLGKKTDAKNVAEKAIELAKKENTDYQSTSELLEQIKLMQ